MNRPFVIASEAKQSSAMRESWITSSLTLLAMTGAGDVQIVAREG